VPKHTVVNLKDVENAAEKFGFAPDMEARFAARDLGLQNSAISYQALAPNFRQPFGHRHEEQEELYVVVSGSGRIKIDDEVVELKTLDAVRVPPEAARALEGGPDGIAFIAIGAPAGGGSPANDAEQLPGWWDGA
jgi:mannose-6-phosphate isomerase-like protein (cupin superfamily)